MRCEACGRAIENSELWKLATDPNAPLTRSMRVLCWTCRAAEAEDRETRPASWYIEPVRDGKPFREEDSIVSDMFALLAL